MEDRLEFEKNICRMIRPLREAAGLKQAETANKLGIGQSQYAYYETGKVCPDLFTLTKLAEIFGIDCTLFLNPGQYAPSR